MPHVALTVPGPPHGKGRPRVTRRGTTYTPARTRAYEATVAAIAAAAWGARAPLDCPVTLEVRTYTRRPTSRSRKSDQPTETIPHTTKPDADNCAKAVKDAIEKAGVVSNDSRVWRLVVEQWWLPVGDTRERVEVVVRW